MRRYGYLADNKNGVTMAHAGEDPPDQPASGQIRTLRRNGLTSPTRKTAYRFPDPELAAGTARPGEAPAGTALAGAVPGQARRPGAGDAGSFRLPACRRRSLAGSRADVTWLLAAFTARR